MEKQTASPSLTPGRTAQDAAIGAQIHPNPPVVAGEMA